MKNITDRDTVEGVLRDLDGRIARQERHSHHGVGALAAGAGMAISGDHNNFSRYGTDAGAYTREIVVKDTPPTTFDFGGQLRPGFVWVQSGGIVAEECATFSDDFERDAIGDDWVNGPLFQYQELLPPIMVDGHIEAAVDESGLVGHLQVSLVTATPYPDDQFIEVDFANVYQGQSVGVTIGEVAEGDCFLYCKATGTGGPMAEDDNQMVLAYISFIKIGSVGAANRACYVVLYQIPSSGISGPDSYLAEGQIDFPQDGSNPTLLMRLETVGTHARCLFNGDLVVEADFDAAVAGGDRVGFGFQWHDTEYTDADPPGESFWVEAARGGCLGEAPPAACETWSDDFERADSALGADWIIGAETGTGENPSLPVIVSGAAVGPGRSGSPPEGYPVGTMQWASEIVAENQYVEITFDNWYGTGASAQAWFELYNFCGGGDPADHSPARRAGGFQFSVSGGLPRVVIDAYTYLDDGDTSDGEFVAYHPYTGSTGTQTLRLESYANGRQVVLLNGTAVIDYIETETPFDATTGHGQGVWLYHWNGTGGLTSPPRVLSFTGGCLEAPSTLSITPMAVGDTELCDDFERADGPLGPQWELYEPWPGDTYVLPTISGGAAIVAAPFDQGAMRWSEDVVGVQTIELEVSGYAQGADDTEANTTLTIHLQGNASDAAAYEIALLPQHPADFYLPNGPNGVLSVTWYPIDASGSSTSIPDPWAFDYLFTQPWAYESSYVVSVEASPTGHLKVWIDGTLLGEADLEPRAGPKMSFVMDWREYSGFVAQPMRIERFGSCGGCQLWAWTGTEWVLGPVSYWDSTQWVPAKACYAWDGAGWQPSLT